MISAIFEDAKVFVGVDLSRDLFHHSTLISELIC